MTEGERDLLAVLREHAARYPLSEPQDAVKLLFQSHFGGEHLIRDEQAFRAYLAKELSETPEDSALFPIERIGSGIVRLALASPAVRSVGADRIADAFFRSVCAHRLPDESFPEKLAFLQSRSSETGYRFSEASLAEYLAGYLAAGCPAVSHSETYRKAYRPAYRILSEKEALLLLDRQDT